MGVGVPSQAPSDPLSTGRCSPGTKIEKKSSWFKKPLSRHGGEEGHRQGDFTTGGKIIGGFNAVPGALGAGGQEEEALRLRAGKPGCLVVGGEVR